MFNNIFVIDTADEILERCFKKASKKTIADHDAFYKKKKTVIARTESFATTLIETLEAYVRSFPSIDNLPMFYQELIHIEIDTDTLKHSLGAISWAQQTSQEIFNLQIKQLKRTGQISSLLEKQKEIYGRLSSIVKQVDKHLRVLSKARAIFQTFPDIQDIPTIVIAGYPNVGKSSLLKQLSKSKPVIAQYPFTTKEIYVGHLQRKKGFLIEQFQLIDTPGLLDRPMEKRNHIELLAIAALQHLAEVIVFLFDSTETCGYSLQDQQHLFEQIKKLFSAVPFVLVENKQDINTASTDFFKISCKTGEGIKELKEHLFSFYPSEDDQKKLK
ncbi:MAG: GTPase [Thermoplasmatota archaeon]